MESLLESVERQQQYGLIKVISLARNSLEPTLKKVRSGEISREEAIRRIIPMIRSMTYTDQYGKNYIVMSDYKGLALVQPFEPEKEMTSEWDLQDIKGTYIVREIVKAAKTNPSGSFVRYYYLPNVYSDQEKMTYVIGIPEIECYIASGMYMQKAVQDQNSMLTRYKYASVGLLLLILIPGAISIFIVIKRNKILASEVAARKNAEEDLEKSEAQYRSIFENSVEGIFQTTIDGRIISVNSVLARIAGYDSPQTLIDAIPCIDRVCADPSERQKVLQIIKDKGFIDDYHLKMRHKDGSVRWISIKMLVVNNGEGHPSYYEGSIEDITERKEAEDAVRNSRKLLNDILQAASEFSIIATDPEGIITVFNRGAELMLGYSSEEIVGKQTPLILFDNLEVAARGRELTTELGCPVEGFSVFIVKPEREGHETREWNYVRKDGSTLPVSLVVWAIRSETNEISGYLGIATDLTKRKQAEKEFRRLASIIRHSSELVNLAELDGQMVFLNEAGQKMLGIEPGDLEKINFMGLIPENMKGLVENQLFPRILDGGIWEGELQYLNLKTRALTDVHNLSFTIDDPDALYKKYLVNVSLDVSQRKQAEDKFTKIFMMAPDGITITRIADGLIIDINMGFQEISGWERKEAVGKTSLDLNFWADPSDRAFLLEELKAGRQIMQQEFRFRRKDGILRNGSYSARPIRIAGEDCLVFIMQDITLRKETESIIRENEERMRSIARNIPGVIYQFHVMENGMLRTEYVSERITPIFGLSAGPDARFEEFLEHVHEEDKQKFSDSIKKAVETLSSWYFEGRFVKTSGDVIWFYGLSTPRLHEDHMVFDGILFDITEIKKTEEISRLAEEKFKNVFMMAPDMVTVTRMEDGLIYDVNIGFEEITGWKRSEVIGLTPYALNFWSSPADRASMVEELNSGSDVVRREIQFRRKDGSMRTGIYSARVIEISGEACLIFVMQDITDRKQAEYALQKTASELQLIFKNMLNAFIMWESVFDENGRYVSFRFGFFNDAYASIANVKKEEVTGRDVFEVWPETEQSWVEVYGKVAVTGDPHTFDMYHTPTKGWYHCNAYRPSDSPMQICVIFEDITESKRAEEALLQSEQQFRGLFESSPSGVALLKDRVFHKVNSMFCEMTGYSSDELLGKDTRMIYEDDYEYDRVGKEIYNRMHQDVPGMIETRIRHKNGKVIDVYASKSQLDPQNASAGTVFTLIDITEMKRLEKERRKLEEQLSQSQKMDAIGQLAGGVAHDFNNILMGIQGNASMSMMEFSPENPHYRRMSRIEEHVKRGANLTRQLLGFAREGKYEPRIFSVNDLLRKSVEFFVETKKEIEASFELDEDLYPIEADAGQMEQVFLNIFINAGHAMPNGGQLHIQTNNLRLDDITANGLGLKPGNYVRISISDTGTGMDSNTLKRIFEPFFTTKSEQGGTGLGLASAYGIIRNHGGTINAYSEPGQGSTFNIYLPSSEKNVECDEAQQPDRQLFLGSGTILIVDDEVSILEVASELLKMLGYTVYKAESAQEAISIYSEKKDIDLVILDMILRGTSGLEVLEALKTINPDVKVILSSGYSLQGEVQKVMEMGCIGFIQKPYNFISLSREVNRAMKPDTLSCDPVNR